MKIRKNIFRNIRTRFDLDVTPPIELAPTVQLVSQVDPLLTEIDILVDDGTAITALTSYFDVPDDEKWTLLWISMYSSASHMMHAYMYQDDTVGPFLTLLEMKNTANHLGPINRLSLMPGWGVQMITAAGTAGSIRHNLYIEKQKWTPYIEQ